jgi:uncharacterized protein YjbI with pentapeptide repeats
MISPEVLAKLIEDEVFAAKWSEESLGLDLRGRILRGAVFNDANLIAVRLSARDYSTDLSRASFKRANLRFAMLSHSTLARTNFTDATLSGADLREAMLAGAIFEDAVLPGANFSRANSRSATLPVVDFRSAKLTGANFDEAKLPGAKFAAARLSGARFVGAKLPGARFRLAALAGAGFASAVLPGANFDHARLSGASFFNATLFGASFEVAKLSGADFEIADLSGASFRGASLVGTDFNVAVVNSADFSGIRLSPEDADTVRKAIATIRLTRYREAAKERVERGLAAPNGVVPDFWDGLRSAENIWDPPSALAPYVIEAVDATAYAAGLMEVLTATACADAHAAEGILNQRFLGRDRFFIDKARALFLPRLVAAADCPGFEGLPSSFKEAIRAAIAKADSEATDR